MMLLLLLIEYNYFHFSSFIKYYEYMLCNVLEFCRDMLQQRFYHIIYNLFISLIFHVQLMRGYHCCQEQNLLTMM